MPYSHCLLLFCLLPVLAMADGLPAAADVKPGIEDDIHALDADHDGQVSISEIRAYLEAKHGKGYRQALLDDMESKASSSCGTPFSRTFY